VNVPDPPRGNHWLLVYLGIGPSNPTWWTVESVAVGKERIILNYQKSNANSANRALHRYCYWIPLGKLDLGTYVLELVDVNKGAVTLMRRVEIASPTEHN
jgi:hypothetical protein